MKNTHGVRWSVFRISYGLFAMVFFYHVKWIKMITYRESDM